MSSPADLANRIVIGLNAVKIPVAVGLGIVAIYELARGAFIGGQDKRTLIGNFIGFIVIIAIWFNIEDMVRWIAHL
jgi:hypothetical protein